MPSLLMPNESLLTDSIRHYHSRRRTIESGIKPSNKSS